MATDRHSVSSLCPLHCEESSCHYVVRVFPHLRTRGEILTPRCCRDDFPSYQLPCFQTIRRWSSSVDDLARRGRCGKLIATSYIWLKALWKTSKLLVLQNLEWNLVKFRTSEAQLMAVACLDQWMNAPRAQNP